jgi:hypothetical protein
MPESKTTLLARSLSVTAEEFRKQFEESQKKTSAAVSDKPPLFARMVRLDGTFVDFVANDDGKGGEWASGDWNDQNAYITVFNGFWGFYQDVNFNVAPNGAPTHGWAIYHGPGVWYDIPPKSLSSLRTSGQ